jgi:hypothetical protein
MSTSGVLAQASDARRADRRAARRPGRAGGITRDVSSPLAYLGVEVEPRPWLQTSTTRWALSSETSPDLVGVHPIGTSFSDSASATGGLVRPPLQCARTYLRAAYERMTIFGGLLDDRGRRLALRAALASTPSGASRSRRWPSSMRHSTVSSIARSVHT